MHLRLFFLTALLASTCLAAGATEKAHLLTPDDDPVKELYHELEIEDVISFPAFEEAIRGYAAIERRQNDILTLIDFSKPSNVERLAVIDMKHGRLIETSVVAHGENSGGLYAKRFSNRVGSHQSSLGFYITGKTYQGDNGYSLRLIGLENGFNDNAFERDVVIHGARYASEKVIGTDQALGRSWGCPALPRDKTNKIINAIKEGSVLFIYAENRNYLAHSPVLKKAKSRDLML